MVFNSKKKIAGLLVGLLSVLGVSSTAMAQEWPAKAVTFLNPFPAGGGTDAFARPLAAQLTEQLGKQFIIDNRGGAGGTVGASVAAKAAPDGYTWFIGASHHTIAPSMYKTLDYDIQKSFIPVALLASVPQVLVVNPGRVNARNLKDFIALMKKNPGKYNFASAGSGTVHHLAGELFKIQTGTFIVHIPYRGAGPAMSDLLAGQVDLEFDGLGTSAPQINAGKLVAIAVAADKRNPAIPNVPTFAEAGLPDYKVSTWYAMFAPAGTPKPIIERFRSELVVGLKSEAVSKQISESMHIKLTLDSSDYLRKFLNEQIKNWGAVVQENGVKID